MSTPFNNLSERDKAQHVTKALLRVVGGKAMRQGDHEALRHAVAVFAAVTDIADRTPPPEASPFADVFDFIAYYGNNAEANQRYRAHKLALIEALEGGGNDPVE